MIIEAKEAFQFDTIDDVVSEIAKGRMVIVTDDADRENEGDLVIAAEKITPEAVNFMATHDREMYRTDFTVSVDAARGVTTGISAQDRATTIRTIADPVSTPDDLVQPGHVF